MRSLLLATACLLPSSACCLADEADPKLVLTMLEAATNAIRSFDVAVAVEERRYIHLDIKEVPGPDERKKRIVITNRRKLTATESPQTRQMYYR